jgi:hypothetical protein
MWNIERTDEIAQWIKGLDDDAKEALLKGFIILKEIGPSLGRPHVDSVKRSRHHNMKELRIQNKLRLFRIFFVFDPLRNVILLIGGDKKGDRRFYQKMIPVADQLYDKYLVKLKETYESTVKKGDI